MFGTKVLFKSLTQVRAKFKVQSLCLHTLPRHVQIRDFHFRYKVHVFVHCPVFRQVQSTCIFYFYRISMYKVQVHQLWYKIRFWGTKVHVFSGFLSAENQFDGRKGKKIKISEDLWFDQNIHVKGYFWMIEKSMFFVEKISFTLMKTCML